MRVDIPEAEATALDAYSRVVIDVAERVGPSVASLRIPAGDGHGPGVDRLSSSPATASS